MIKSFNPLRVKKIKSYKNVKSNPFKKNLS